MISKIGCIVEKSKIFIFPELLVFTTCEFNTNLPVLFQKTSYEFGFLRLANSISCGIPFQFAFIVPTVVILRFSNHSARGIEVYRRS